MADNDKPWEDEDPISWTTQTGVAASQWGKPREEHKKADDEDKG